MNSKSNLPFLKKVELFKTLSDEELLIISHHIEPCVFSKHALLFSENNPRDSILLIVSGKVTLFKKTPFGEEKTLAIFSQYDFLGEGAIIDDTPHFTSARAKTDVSAFMISKENLIQIFSENGGIAMTVHSYVARVISRRMRQANSRVLKTAFQYGSGRTRIEHDLLGDRNIPQECYYGIQTLRALENFDISGITLNFFPILIEALAAVKYAAAEANYELELLDQDIRDAIVKACQEIRNKRFHHHFVVDMIQGGAGTSTNMNANEVIANRALEILGHERGEYKYCHPNNHVNLSQSTNDAYPTALKIALYNGNTKLVTVLEHMIDSLRNKATEFSKVIKMGRTQLQDAVPMTLGQSFESYAVTFEDEISRLNENAALFLEVNMGATAIGTGINTDPDYRPKVVQWLRQITGLDIKSAENLVEATQDTGSFVMYSSAIKSLAVKLSKMCNDLRLLSSGPRAGLNEINLPKKQPGSSIMPGKVNPVIPEVVNQVAFKVIGNDLTVSLASEAGQLELNVMEPIIAQSIFESVEMLKNSINTLTDKCLTGITANEKHVRDMVINSIGIVTALNPVLGYEISTKLAKDALEGNRSVYDLVLERNLLSKKELDDLLSPENMISPKKMKRS